MPNENYICEYCDAVCWAVKFSYQSDSVCAEALCYSCALAFIDDNPGEYCGELVKQLAEYEAEIERYSKVVYGE